MGNVNIDGKIIEMLAEGRNLYYIIGFLKGTLEQKGNQEKALAVYEEMSANKEKPWDIIIFLKNSINNA